MKVEFDQTADDFILFYRSRRIVRRHIRRLARTRNSPIPRPRESWLSKLAVALCFGGPALSFASALYLSFASSLLWLAAVAIIGAFLTLMILIVLKSPLPKATRQWFEKDPANTLPTTAEITDAAMHFNTSISRNSIEWPGILGVLNLPQSVVVLEMQNLAHVIPHRAFANDEEIKSFVAAIESKTQVQHTAL